MEADSMHKRLIPLSALLLICILLLNAGVAWAQSLYFEVPEVIVDVYWNDDGTSSQLRHEQHLR
jgi:hypothetical protein